jgi:hypothetical protein
VTATSSSPPASTPLPSTGGAKSPSSTSTHTVRVPLKRPDRTTVFEGASLHLYDGSTSTESAATARQRKVDDKEIDFRAFRTAPLLRLTQESGSRLLIVGQWGFFVVGERLEVHAYVSGLWTEADGRWEYERQPGLDQVATALTAGCFSAEHTTSASDAQSLITVLAKASAEASRGAVADLRRIRYSLENDLASKIRNQEPDKTTLAALVALRTAVGKARDEAMVAIRYSLSMLHDDPDAYQMYRLAMDPTLLLDYPPADVWTRPWMQSHDAGMRQCRAMSEQLWDEAVSLAQSLDASTTISAARDAAAQETFNILGTFAAVGIGIPSLLLAYYGADRLLPVLPMSWNGAAPLLLVLTPIIFMLIYFGRAGSRHLLPNAKKVLRGVCVAAIVLVGVAALTFQT